VLNIGVIAPTEIPSLSANSMQVMKMTQAFAVLGHNVHLFAPRFKLSRTWDKINLSVPASQTEHSVDWEALERHYGLKYRFAITWLPANPKLRRYDFGYRAVRSARCWGANLVYTRLPQAAALSSITGIATIHELHDLPRGQSAPMLLQIFLNSQAARRLVLISQALLNDLSQIYNIPSTPPFTIICPDGVDLDRYKNLPNIHEARLILCDDQRIQYNKPIQPEDFVAGYTGHLYPGRGMDFLLELASHLPGITFLVVGGEPEDVIQFQNKVNSLALKNVIVTGFVPNADLPIFQATCDVLLMPYESKVAASSGGDISRYLSPMKLFEYLASERTILSSDLPVLKEILNFENAILLPMNDFEAWTETLQELRANPDKGRKLAARARQDAKRNTWENRSETILSGLNL